MKYNKIVKESDIKNTNTFLISCVCSIVLLLTMCYFGINSNIKGTAAVTLYTCDGGETTQTSSTCTKTLSFKYDTAMSNACYYRLNEYGWKSDCDISPVDDDNDGERDYYQYECTCTKNASTVEKKCSDFSIEGAAVCNKVSGCEWDYPNGVCRTKSSSPCSSYSNNESACKAAGCNYVAYSGVCNSSTSSNTPNCSNGTTKTLCESIAGCTYTSSGCVPVNTGDSNEVSCDAGKYLKDGSCVSCPANKYCTGGTSQPQNCPEDKPNASSGSTSVSACYAETTAAKCYYVPSSNAYQWSNTPISGASPVADSNCEGNTGGLTCSPGKYPKDGSCVSCPANKYCLGGNSQPQNCPSDRPYAPANSMSSTACYANVSEISCEAGKYWHNGESICKACPAGYYCTGGGVGGEGINKCPDGTTSQEGSKTNSDCKSSGSTGGGNNNDNPSGGGNNSTTTCEAGKYWHNGESICKTCPAGLYCTGGGPGGEGINHCPEGTTSPEGSDSSSDCKASGSTGGGNNDTPSGGNGGTTVTKTFKATFNANGGTLNGSSSKSCSTSGSSCNITDLPTASKNGYTFKGWNTSSSCTSGSTSSLTLNAHTTYYACYASNSSGGNVEENPSTGEITIALVWFFGIFALAYSVVYFRDVKEK